MHLFDHRLVALEEMMQDPAICLQSIADFLGVEPHPDQASFLRQRQVTSRGGAFSSFRDPHEVQLAWRRHLSARQVEVIEDVLFAAQRETLGDALTTKWKDSAA